MKLPSSKKALTDEAILIANQCLNSQQDRMDQYVKWRNYLYAGSPDMSKPAILNKIGAHIDRLASNLFSPAEARFLVEFGTHADDEWQKREPAISRHLTDECHGADVDLAFAEAVFWALPYGSAFVKLLWNEHKGLDPYVVMPYQLGVWREDINGLDRQEAIAHVTYLSRHELRRRVAKLDNKNEIMERVSRYNLDRTEDDIDNIVHQVIIGGVNPVTTGSPSGTKGSVDVFNAMGLPQMPADVVRELVRFVELWIIDEDTGDYTTLQYVEPDVLIEGSDRKRNIFLPGRQPFKMAQANEQRGYFWGRSECSDLYYMQDIIAQRLNEISKIWTLRAKPPRGLIGFSALTDEARRAFSSPDGLIMNDNPNAKIQDLAPELPSDAFQQVDSVIRYFDDTAGFPPIAQGQGEPGVRAGQHADSLQRSASARMRDRALKVERQYAEVGELALETLAAKDPTAFGKTEDDAFLLDQMPEDRKVSVDSHSSSPAFTSDHRVLAFSLARAGAVTPEGLLMLTNPPQLDVLLQQLRAKQEQEAKLIQEHPELLQKGKRKR